MSWCHSQNHLLQAPFQYPIQSRKNRAESLKLKKKKNMVKYLKQTIRT